MGSEKGSFSGWLLLQCGRTDGVGRLANRFAEGVRLGRHRGRFQTPKQFKRGVVERYGGYGMRPLFDLAKREFESR